MEPSIPQHLMASRTQPLRMREGHTPPYPSYSGRFGELNQGVVCTILGVQERGSLSNFAQAALREMWQTCGGQDAPGSREVAKHIDERGYENRVIIAYWDETETFDRWFERHQDVVGQESIEGYGRWLEVIRSSPEDIETLYSSDTFPEGASKVAAEGFSREILEHGYWGSMRDRLPRSQVDPLKPVGAPTKVNADTTTRVQPHDNFTIIRSGQDWTECGPEEKAKYFEDVEPQLQAGMDFLLTQGDEVGCYSNRYMRSCDLDGNLLPHSFGLSFWRSLADLEQWAESHPTHVRIFGAAMKFLRDNANTKLRLSHEVSVVPRQQQYFEYNNCHETTGMLGGSS